MRNGKSRGSGVVTGILLPMGLICMFAFCSLALSLMGGSAYRAIQANIDKQYDTVVASSYLRTKLSQNNTAGAVSLRDEQGTTVLVITASYDAGSYETRIFMHEGMLVETFTEAEQPFNPALGTELAQLASCEFSISENGLFEADIVGLEGNTTRASFALAGGTQ